MPSRLSDLLEGKVVVMIRMVVMVEEAEEGEKVKEE